MWARSWSAGRLLLAACLLGGQGGLFAADEAPEWIEAAMKAPAAKASRSRRVVLFEERRVDVSRASAQRRTREAVRLLDVEMGKALFFASQSAGDKFKLVGAWRVRPNGSAQKFEPSSITQVDADATYEFSSTKVNVFVPSDVRSGDVVGWEYVITSPVEAYTDDWSFGGSDPTSISRFAIRIPSDWEVRSQVVNHPGLTPAADDEDYRVWEMRNLEALRDEPLSDSLIERSPRLLVAYGPKDKSARREFDTWESVSRWYADIVSRQAIGDKTIQEAAAKVAGTSTGLDAIRAVTEFTQGLRYLNVAVGRSVAEPHAAADILRNRFGDCEDKTVLTIALLRAIGVDAYPMLALTDSGGAVVPEFPSPMQFNHAIVAVKAPADAGLASTFEAGSLGRLAAFDPTSSTTALGDFPSYLQGTRAVVAHPTSGGLVSLPVLPPESSERRAETQVVFAQPAGVDVTTKVAYTGQYASDMRFSYAETTGAQRSERLLTWLKSNYGDGRVKRMDVSGEASPRQDLMLDMQYWMPIPGKDLGDLRTIDVGIGVYTRAERLPAGERFSPIVIEEGYVETSRTAIAIPEGWRLSPPLPAAEAASEAGEYRLSVQQEGDRLIVQRVLKVKASRIPAKEYAAVRAFFDAVARGDSGEVVLEKGKAPGGTD